MQNGLRRLLPTTVPRPFRTSNERVNELAQTMNSLPETFDTCFDADQSLEEARTMHKLTTFPPPTNTLLSRHTNCADASYNVAEVYAGHFYTEFGPAVNTFYFDHVVSPTRRPM